MPTQPQDRRPKKGAPFTFKVGTKVYTLPNADKGKSKMTGRDLRDAAVGGEAGQAAYMFKVLEAAGPTKEALDALYGLSQDKMMDVLMAWGQHGDGDGASLGE